MRFLVLAALSSMAAIAGSARAATHVDAATLEGCPANLVDGRYVCDNGDYVTVTTSGNDTVVTRRPAAPKAQASAPAKVAPAKADTLVAATPLRMLTPVYGSLTTRKYFPDFEDGDKILPVNEAPTEPGSWERRYCVSNDHYCLWRIRNVPTERLLPPPELQVARAPAPQPTWEQQHRPDPSCRDVPHDVNYVLAQPTQGGGAEICTRQANPTGAQVAFRLLGMGLAGYAIHESYGYYGRGYYRRGPCSMPPGYTGPIIPCR